MLRGEKQEIQIADQKLLDPGFESGTTNFWTLSGDGSFAIEGTIIYSGIYSGKITPDANDTVSLINNGRIVCHQGQYAKATLHHRSDANITSNYVDFYWYDQNKDYIGKTSGSSSTVSVGTFTTVNVSAAVPAGAFYFSIALRVTSGSTAGNTYLDGCVAYVLDIGAAVVDTSGNLMALPPSDYINAGNSAFNVYITNSGIIPVPEYYLGSDCSGVSGAANRVLTLANTVMSHDGLVLLDGVALAETGEFTWNHLAASSTVTFLVPVWNDQKIIVLYFK
jgi:hypothetical protein